MIIIIDILVKRELSTNLMKEIWKSFLNIQFHTEASFGASMKINHAKCLYFLNKKEDFYEYAENLLCELSATFSYNEIISLAEFYIPRAQKYEFRNKCLTFELERALAQLEIDSFVKGIQELKNKEKLTKHYMIMILKLSADFIINILTLILMPVNILMQYLS